MTSPEVKEQSSSGATIGLADWVPAIPLVGMLCYGAGWIYYSSIFAQLGVAPEEVGIGTEYLLVRSALIIGGTLMAIATLFVLSGAAGKLWRGQPHGSTVVQLWLVAAALTLLLVSAGLAYTLTTSQWPHVQRWIHVLVAVPLGLTVMILASLLVMAGFGYRTSHRGTGFTSDWSSLHLVAVSVIFIFAIFSITYWAGRHLGQDIAQGRSIENPVLTIRNVVVQDVQTFVAALPSGTEEVSRSMGISAEKTGESDVGNDLQREVLLRVCFLHLGSADGNAVLYDARDEVLVLVSAQNIVMSSRRSEEC